MELEYIPAGCIRIEPNFPDEEFVFLSSLGWRSAKQRHDDDESKNFLPSQLIPSVYQDSLMSYAPLGDVDAILLLQDRWIHLEFLVLAPKPRKEAIVRVYLLPDDAFHHVVDRSNKDFQKARRRLLSHLDFSSALWNGERDAKPSPLPEIQGQPLPDDLESKSLLQMFNSIPSPDPMIEDVSSSRFPEKWAYDAMYRILYGKTIGIRTELFDHQKRSAASMLCREARPGKIADPRLLAAKDQAGNTWYYDSIARSPLREPRVYDGVSGGILAEEMGSGKTLICLAVIVASRYIASEVPDKYRNRDLPRSKKIASLLDMAAHCAARNGVPWRGHYDLKRHEEGMVYDNCVRAAAKHLTCYDLPYLDNKGLRPKEGPPRKIYMSHASLVIVPDNLFHQWLQEIEAHTEGLKVLAVHRNLLDPFPSGRKILDYDIILFPISRFEKLKQPLRKHLCPLEFIHFRRCIVDEGHQIGSAKFVKKRDLLVILDRLLISHRWIVTGTPTTGLYGVENDGGESDLDEDGQIVNGQKPKRDDEANDIERIGAMARLYLRAHPWTDPSGQPGHLQSDWAKYIMPAKHDDSSRLLKRACLMEVVNSLIIRHQLADINGLLPAVNETTVFLDGSYQDRLSLNLFNMMIVLNAVQSQRCDEDYFFFRTQTRTVSELVKNLKLATFFGGTFFTPAEIETAVETAEAFLVARNVPISDADEQLLREAVRFGRFALEDRLHALSIQFQEIPVYVSGIPGDAGRAWSLDEEAGELVCTSPGLLLKLQETVGQRIDDPAALNGLLNGQLAAEGALNRAKLLSDLESRMVKRPEPSEESAADAQWMAGNTNQGTQGVARKLATLDPSKGAPTKGAPTEAVEDEYKPAWTEATLPVAFRQAKIVSTVSAKLSYIIGAISKHHAEEQILVFYEDENIAWFLATMLEVLQIQHLIYAKGLGSERRSQYVHSFMKNQDFRVLVMDLSQAAVGLDLHTASRVYFLSPIINPQIEVQAIGRIRRISQSRPVAVETLVLRDSIDEVIAERRKNLAQAERRRIKGVLDDSPTKQWIRERKILPMAEEGDRPSARQDQMAKLDVALPILFWPANRLGNPDEGLVGGNSPVAKAEATAAAGHAEQKKRSSTQRNEGEPKTKRAKP